MKLGGFNLDGAFGGYQIVNVPANKLPQDAASAISSVNGELLGATYQPIWYVGSQVVNGMNHLFIAEEIRATKKATKMIVGLVINVPPGGGEGAKIVNIIEEADLPAEVQDAFDATVRALVGMNYRPIAYIGKQQVSKSMNHAIICEAKLVYATETEPKPVIVKINIAGPGQYTLVGVEGIDSMNAVGYAFTW